MFKKRHTLFSLFSGIGGIDIGFMQAGFEVVGANEYDVHAAITYMYNLCNNPVHIHFLNGDKDKARLEKELKKHIEKDKDGNILSFLQSGAGWIASHPEIPPVKNYWFGDVCKLKGDDILDTLNLDYGEISCVAGGPPCQGFSYAGKREQGDKRNKLLYEMGRLIIELMPQTFFLENVPGIRTMKEPDGTLVMDNFLEIVKGAGFTAGATQKISKDVLSTANSLYSEQKQLWMWS